MSLPDSALTLLPNPDEAVRCAVHAANIGVVPAGTAIAADAVVLVETPRPWPKPVFAHPLLEGLASMMQLRSGAARVLACERTNEIGHGTDARDSAPHGSGSVLVFERGEVGMVPHRFEVEGARELKELFGLLTDHYPGEIGQFRSDDPAPELAVLVCTQGSHDVCCGSDGVRFANELEQAAPGLAVYRVSHTGGHRFAPTAMTLPDGRMWAGLELDTALSILDLTADPAVVADRCRGWWGASTGPAQVAEVAVLRELGWDLDLQPRQVTVHEAPDGAWRAEVEVARRTWQVDIFAGRVVPTIACRAEGGLPAKVAQEYEVIGLSPPA